MQTFTSKVEFLRQIFGAVDTARDGINVAVRCPACGDESSKRKFSINTETWQCHCWICGIKGGNPYKIFKDSLGTDIANFFRDTFIQNKTGSVSSNIEIEESVSLPDSFLPLFINLKHRDPDVKDCLSYLRSRGMTHRDLWYFKLGTSLSGRFRRRIIIPSFNVDGDLNYFSARAIDDGISRKYINSKASKSDIIFNEINIDWKRELTVTEGPFDLFKSNQNSTCILGSSIHEGTYLFKRIVANKTPVLLALDSDMKAKSIKIAELLISYDCDVRILSLGNFLDVGEMTKIDFLKARENSSEWTRFLSLIERISSIGTGSLA